MSNVRRYVPGASGPSVSVVDAPLAVGRAAADRRPLARLAEFEDDGEPLGRCAASDVEHVCRDHRLWSWSSATSLVSRRRVIFRCSSAAMRNSAPGSFGSRRSRSVQHLGSRLAGRADDENVSESRFVVAVCLGQALPGCVGRLGHGACSCADHARSSDAAALLPSSRLHPTARPAPPAPPAPIFGCAANASSQSSRSSASNARSAASAIVLGIGERPRCRHPRGPAREPQQRSEFAASQQPSSSPFRSSRRIASSAAEQPQAADAAVGKNVEPHVGHVAEVARLRPRTCAARAAAAASAAGAPSTARLPRRRGAARSLRRRRTRRGCRRPGALPLKWRVSTSTRRIVPAAPSRTIVQSWPGPRRRLRFPAVAHVRRIAGHDQVVPRAEEHVAARHDDAAVLGGGQVDLAAQSQPLPVGHHFAVDAQARDAAVGKDPQPQVRRRRRVRRPRRDCACRRSAASAAAARCHAAAVELLGRRQARQSHRRRSRRTPG